MKRAIAGLAVAMLCVSVCGLAAADQAASAGAAREPINLEVRDASIPYVVESVTTSWGDRIRLEGEVTGTISLKDAYTSVEQVLGDICKAQPYYWWRDSDGSYVLSSHPRAGSADSQQVPASFSAIGKRVTRWQTLRFTSPQQMAYLFGFADSPGPEMMPAADVLAPGAVSAGYGIGELSGGGRAGGRAGGAGGGRAGGAGGGRAGGAGGGRAGGAGGGRAGGGVIGITGGGGGGGVVGVLGGLLPPGITDMVAYPMLNAIIVQGTEEGVNELIELLKLLDRKPPQVTVELQSVQVSRSVLKAMGISWYWQLGSFKVEPANMSTEYNLRIGYNPANNRDFSATLTALLTTGGGRVIDAIRVTTMNLLPASNTVTVQYPIIQVGGVAGGPVGGQGVQTITVTSENHSTYISVVPRVNADGTITMTIPYTKSAITGYIDVPVASFGVVQRVPIWTTTSILTTVNVVDGQTFVLGGFVGTSENSVRMKLPVLGDLPIIGDLLFTRKTYSLNDSEVLIFVTAHVIKEEAEPATLGPI
jgi:type II secretory pathway component GspD/PulD (secretin)